MGGFFLGLFQFILEEYFIEERLMPEHKFDPDCPFCRLVCGMTVKPIPPEDAGRCNNAEGCDDCEHGEEECEDEIKIVGLTVNQIIECKNIAMQHGWNPRLYSGSPKCKHSFDRYGECVNCNKMDSEV
jgi:hypothetical protein